MMTSTQIRQSFLDFFKSKQHTIVPSSSLLPDSPNLLFTNAGMNQFVPIFLGETACPYSPGRAADTQKCIRAGGKHNDLDDVGLDTYHHTFFEMLGNWSFGDYFKPEAIGWAWELVVEVWKFPPHRLYATIYQPDKSKNDPADRDQEAWDLWAAKFRSVGLDPDVHIVNGNKKDNFWMMGETGPCGPCTEVHVDLRPGPVQTDLDTQKSGALLVNGSDARCIEIWNNVFIQYNADPDGTFSPLPAQHVDTGMGFERVTSILQGTKGLTDFQNAKISNYETDIFRPIFDELEKMSGKKYGSTLPGDDVASDSAASASGTGAPPVPITTGGGAGATTSATKEQVQLDIAFRVIADHIRTLSFAIADGIQPGNTDRNYVLRRILRRAVRYGRTLGFHEPFFYKLVDVLARTMGDVFPEIRAKQQQVKDTLKLEEESFNKTLDKGIALFNDNAASLLGTTGTAPAPGAADRALAVGREATENAGSKYFKRHLPHFERPWGKYMVTFSTREKRQLAPTERDIVLESVLYAHNHRQYQLFAACVMPDHVHLLFEPQIKEQDQEGKPMFWSLSEILQGIKSTTAHRINKAAKVTGVHVWEEESFDRLMRGDSDLQEKFHYICRNPWDNGVVPVTEPYQWLWTPDVVGTTPVPGVVDRALAVDSGTAIGETTSSDSERPTVSRGGAGNNARGGRAPQISGAFAFRLYDEQGFPLDLTELMARERGLTVDKEGFEKLMDEQRARARAAQKKQVIELSQIETKTPTHFLGFDHTHTGADVQEVVQLKDKTVVVLNNSVCYAEMGGQVGDTGELSGSGQLWRVVNTQKSGNTVLHFIEGGDAPAVGSHVTVQFNAARRAAIQRHHTVTHLLHWALHEVASREASQKGSNVTPEKLTFDFNSAPLSHAQVAEIELKVNEKILENEPVSWFEVPHSEVKGNPKVMQFFGDKYGDVVRVVQIGGRAQALDGYSMELCGGTHTRATGEIGLFRIVSEAAVAAGVRRIEAVAGLSAYASAKHDLELIRTVAGKIGAPVGELEKKLDALLAQQKELERQLKTAIARNASNAASELLGRAQTVNGVPLIVHNLGDTDGDFLQAVVDALKSRFQGVIVLGGGSDVAVSLVAAVTPEFTKQAQAGKIIQTIAPIVGGNGGGRPDNARGGGKDAAKLDEALAKVRTLI
jgi:alanyl-tRNA synthetase/REP element-mobilizing transposase RayT